MTLSIQCTALGFISCVDLHVGIHGCSMIHFKFDICLSMKLSSVTRVMASVQLLAGVMKQDSQTFSLRDGEPPSHAGAWRCGSQTG